ncbi:hypothetical protein HPP_5010 [Hydrangea phyllody phytoplasma]|uniref:PAM522 homologue n=2 Tax=16SrI (Aster yellows group) TaxID=3042590 RepID=A0ABQ5PT70_9MOLU|nr:hypothetical protein [Hydrangea phyllody phytoplasma]GFZ75543.1 hypothetical protein HPP_5010 [Hydrangea phyllody phytoplasma]GLH61489.1 hypothetical protein RHYP_4350 [Rhus yellows phytoplasma]GLH62094.1 hypothetical protein HP2P_5010 [Hydrangea phyllody phytoplasma]
MLISEKILSQIKPDNYFKYPFNQYMQLNHQSLNHYFQITKSTSQKQKVLRGKINEYLILIYFRHYGITKQYPQTYLFFIPDIKFDLVLFTQNKRIIAFNFKTCLRERYKQAIIEAQQLKKLDTRFEYYLLTNDAIESQRLNNKIKNGKVQGINQVIDCFSQKANIFLKTLFKRQFISFKDINLIKNTKGNIKNV